jgi:hypothetical protein
LDKSQAKIETAGVECNGLCWDNLGRAIGMNPLGVVCYIDPLFQNKKFMVHHKEEEA